MLQVYIFVLISLCSAREITFPDAESGACKTKTGNNGWCVDLQKCRPVLKETIWGNSPTHCGFKGKKPIVCCPFMPDRLEGQFGGRITLANVPAPTINFECGKRGKSISRGRRSKRNAALKSTFNSQVFAIGGGFQSIRNSWPWMALLGRRLPSGKEFFCSGVLINEKYVITAAHCLLVPRDFFVRLGEHNYEQDDVSLDHEGVEDIGVQNIIFHPKYDLEKGYHDVALLQLSRDVEFRNEISPICLPWGAEAKENLVGEQVTIAGWGRLSFGGPQSPVLNEVEVTVFEPKVCEESYSTLRDFEQNFPEGMTRENIVCAGDQNGVKDACEGDSGGPMMHKNKSEGRYSLAGVVSKGFGCGLKEFPGLYAPLRNSETLRWIKQTAFS